MGIDSLRAQSPGSDLVNVVIDTPRGSGNKFKYDEAAGLFRLSRMLPAGMHFPYDFGWIPGTRAEDGDPLDVLVLMEAPTFPGCLVTVKLIGVLRATQREKRQVIRNDRLLGVAQTPTHPARIESIEALDRERLRDIGEFFVSYNRIQGREFTLRGHSGAAGAQRLLAQALRTQRRT